MNQRKELGAFGVELAGALGFETEERAGWGRCGRGGDSARSATETLQIFGGKIDAAAGGIFRNVAENVGELEGEAEVIGQLESARIGKTEDADAALADDAGDTMTIEAQIVEGAVGRRVQIHLSAGDELFEIAGRNRIFGQCFRQCGQDNRSRYIAARNEFDGLAG